MARLPNFRSPVSSALNPSLGWLVLWDHAIRTIFGWDWVEASPLMPRQNPPCGAGTRAMAHKHPFRSPVSSIVESVLWLSWACGLFLPVCPGLPCVFAWAVLCYRYCSGVQPWRRPSPLRICRYIRSGDGFGKGWKPTVSSECCFLIEVGTLKQLFHQNGVCRCLPWRILIRVRQARYWNTDYTEAWH